MCGMYVHTVQSAHILRPVCPCVSLHYHTIESLHLLSNAKLISLYMASHAYLRDQQSQSGVQGKCHCCPLYHLLSLCTFPGFPNYIPIINTFRMELFNLNLFRSRWQPLECGQFQFFAVTQVVQKSVQRWQHHAEKGLLDNSGGFFIRAHGHVIPQ